MLNHLKIHSRSDSPGAINSIRRSATTQWATTASGNVAKPMTSVFYDVIRGRSNVLIEGHFWRFWGI